MEKSIAVSASLNKKRIPMYGIGFIAYMFVLFHRMAASVMAPDIIGEFAVSAVEAGLLGALFMYTYAIMNLPAGLLSDSLGPRRTIGIALAVSALGSFFFGFAASYTMVLIGRVLVAIGAACIFAPVNKLFAEWSSKKQFATLSGSLLSWGRLGAIVATTPLALLLVVFGWRSSFMIIGAVTAILSILAFVFIRNKPSDVGLTSPDEMEDKTAAAPKEKVSVWKGLGQVFTKPQFWFVIIFAISINGTANAIIATWGGLFFQNGMGLSQVLSSSVLLTAGITSLFGGILAGLLADRKFTKKSVAMFGSIVFIVLWGIMAFWADSLPLWMYYVVIGYAGFAEVWCVTMVFGLSRIMFPARVIGTVVGGINFVCWAAGAGIFAQVWGFFVQGSATVEAYSFASFQSAFIFQWFVLLVGLVALILVKERPIPSLIPGAKKELS